MRYGIVGIGPIGGLFASLLKNNGHEVSVLCRNRFRKELFEEENLKISGKLDFKVQMTDVYTQMEDFVASEPSVIFICTKSSQSTTVLRQIRSFNPSPDTVFVACQNGIDVEDQISEIFGPERTLRVILNLGGNFVRPNEIWVSFCFEQYLSKNPACGGVDEQILKDLEQGGLKAKLVDNYKEEAFKKAVLNSALGTVCALTRMTMKQVMAESELENMVTEIIRESIEIGKKLGYEIEEFLQPALNYLSNGGDHKPSMLVDIEKARLTENEYHCGKLFRYGRDLGLEVPVIQTVYYLAKSLEKTSVLNSYVSEGMKELSHG